MTYLLAGLLWAALIGLESPLIREVGIFAGCESAGYPHPHTVNPR